MSGGKHSPRPPARSSHPDPGTSFGRWRVLGPAETGWSGDKPRARVRVECVCGERKTHFVDKLRRGRATGCARASCRESHARQIQVPLLRRYGVSDREILRFVQGLPPLPAEGADENDRCAVAEGAPNDAT